MDNMHNTNGLMRFAKVAAAHRVPMVSPNASGIPIRGPSGEKRARNARNANCTQNGGSNISPTVAMLVRGPRECQEVATRSRPSRLAR